MKKKLKHQFLDAVISGELGTQTERGMMVTTKEFVQYFIHESKKSYLRCYLPSVSIETGRYEMKHNKYLFKIGRGIFKIHEDAITKHYFKHSCSLVH